MKCYIDDTIEQAYELLLDGELEESAKILETKQKEQPDCIQIILELGNIYYILGIMAKSVIYYEKALLLKPGSPYILYRMGVALYRSTHFLRAVDVFRKIIDSGKYLPMTYLWLGLSYYHLGKEDKSIEAYRDLLSFCPDTMMANYYMGVALKASGKYDEAILHFEKLINKTDQHVSALYHLGRAYMKNFNYEKAKSYFKRAIELDPENTNATEMYNFLINA
jgi:tetratricopeptide (TPR) repeat protein